MTSVVQVARLALTGWAVGAVVSLVNLLVVLIAPTSRRLTNVLALFVAGLGGIAAYDVADRLLADGPM